MQLWRKTKSGSPAEAEQEQSLERDKCIEELSLCMKFYAQKGCGRGREQLSSCFLPFGKVPS